MRAPLALAGALACLPAAPAAGQAPAPGTPSHPRELVLPPLRPYLPPVPTRTELEGGGVLLSIEDRELPLVDGVLLFRGGTAEVPAERAGLLELLAEALREGGSERTPGAQLDAWLDSHAATLEVRAERDALRFEFSCVEADLGRVLEYLGELIALPAYPEAAVEGSRNRLLTRIARRDEDPASLARHLLDRVVYGADAPRARRPQRAAVQAATRRALLEHHRRVLGPQRLLAGATGAVSALEMAARLEALLSGVGGVEPPPRPTPAAFRRPSRTRIHLYDRPGLPQAEIRLAGPGTRRLQRDYAPLYLWSYALGAGGTSNRLMVRLRTELGLVYQGSLFFAPGWGRAGRLLGSTSTRVESVPRVLEELGALLQAGLAPLEAQELEAVRGRVLNAEVFQVDRPEKVLARALDLELHGYPPDFWERRAERLRSLSAREVARAVGRYVDADRLVLVVVGPAAELRESLEALGEVVLLEPLAGAQDD